MSMGPVPGRFYLKVVQHISEEEKLKWIVNLHKISNQNCMFQKKSKNETTLSEKLFRGGVGPIFDILKLYFLDQNHCKNGFMDFHNLFL